MQLTPAPLSRTTIYWVCAIWTVILALLFAFDLRLIEAAADLPQWVRGLSHIVTRLGNADWMAVVTLSIAAAGALLARGGSRMAWRRHGRLILRAAVVFFVIVLISGIAVQVLKHLIGRGRPALLEDFGAYAFAPFQPGSPFNSFPSGHSSTVAALAVLLSWLFPRFWPVWVGAALAIGMSRVTTLNHYASDVFAGWALGVVVAGVGLSLTLTHGLLPQRGGRAWRALGARLSRTGRNYALHTAPLTRKDLVLASRLMLAILATLFLFQAVPQIDLWVAGLFFVPGKGFVLNGMAEFQMLRETYKLTMYLCFLAVLVMWAMALRLGDALAVPARLWGFALAGFVLGPGLLSNGILKEYWGRARPGDVENFGGEHPFTAAGLKVDHCQSNCSFVSGE